jgi:glycosyltransferase involved in cell wall biosynthesis
VTDVPKGCVPTIAVIIPVHNRTELLGRSLSSVLDQASPSIAIYVVDDGSEPPLALERTWPRVHVLRVPHCGASAARNAGVAAASDSDWVTFLDSDDEVAPGWLSAIADAANRGAALFSCAAEYCWDDGEVEVARPVPMWPGSEPRALFLAGAFAVRRELFLQVHGYHNGLRHGENTDLGWRLAEVMRATGVPTVATDRPLVTVHARRTRRDATVLLESARMVLADPPALLAEDRRAMATHYAIASNAAKRLGHRREAVRWAVSAVRCDPLHVRHSANLLRALTGRVRP